MQSESGVDINIRRFFAETLVLKPKRFSLNVQFLGLNPNTVKTCSNASLGFLLVNPLDVVDDHTLALNLDALYDPL